ncbi:MAG: hypothetical protein JNM93_11290 [Bacteriovoracaceae bacterium]|nr:hypothetical protein [Bacteriovoracaceae bacterium]
MRYLAYCTVLFGLLVGQRAFADPQWAIVITDKAIIYADPERTSPIGYIAKGKKFKVGQVPRNEGTMLPLVVSGRITYINIKDVYLAHDQAFLELPADRYKKVQRYEEFEKDITIFLSGYTSNLPSGAYDTNVDDANSASFFGLTIQGMTLLEPRWYLGTSFSYERSEVETQTLTNLYINVDFMYKFLNNYRYYLGSTFLLGFSPNTRLVVDDAFKLSGQSVQVGAGLEFGYLFERFEFKLITGYKFQAYTNFDIPSTLEEFRPAVHGLFAGVGLAYNY